jgi:L-lactate dehydrogenase (cytochrome)
MTTVQKHNSQESCWVVLYGRVYNLTSFLHQHPGGANIILAYAGHDATEYFEPFHPADILATSANQYVVGDVEPTSLAAYHKQLRSAESKAKATSQHEKKSDSAHSMSVSASLSESNDAFEMPPLSAMLNMYDFEAAASHIMKPAGWAYYSSGADDEITLRENHAAFQRIWIRPRVLVDVSRISMRSKILGHNTAFPVYVTATALGRLADPAGETALTRACHTHGIIQMIPTLASCTLDEILAARAPGQVQFFQLYVNADRKLTEQLIRRVEAGGCKALVLTVDAPRLGRREKDMRTKMQIAAPDLIGKKKTIKKLNRDQGTARAISAFIDPSLCWKDLAWIRSVTSLPIVLKGIQTAEDALLAVEHGVSAIILSNHGGRQLDFARSGIEILPEVMGALRSAGVADAMEVWIDGGIRRGTDIFKALALGAKAVGIGRPFLYALAAYGQEGVEHAMSLLAGELEMAMALSGAPSIESITERMVSIETLSQHVGAVPPDHLSARSYIPMKLAGSTIHSRL